MSNVNCEFVAGLYGGEFLDGDHCIMKHICVNRCSQMNRFHDCLFCNFPEQLLIIRSQNDNVSFQTNKCCWILNHLLI